MQICRQTGNWPLQCGLHGPAHFAPREARVIQTAGPYHEVSSNQPAEPRLAFGIVMQPCRPWSCLHSPLSWTCAGPPQCEPGTWFEQFRYMFAHMRSLFTWWITTHRNLVPTPSFCTRDTNKKKFFNVRKKHRFVLFRTGWQGSGFWCIGWQGSGTRCRLIIFNVWWWIGWSRQRWRYCFSRVLNTCPG